MRDGVEPRLGLIGPGLYPWNNLEPEADATEMLTRLDEEADEDGEGRTRPGQGGGPGPGRWLASGRSTRIL